MNSRRVQTSKGRKRQKKTDKDVTLKDTNLDIIVDGNKPDQNNSNFDEN